MRGLLNTNWPVIANNDEPWQVHSAKRKCLRFLCKVQLGGWLRPRFTKSLGQASVLERVYTFEIKQSRICEQRSARRQKQRYVEYFGKPERVRQKFPKSSTQGAAKEARDHTIIDRSCMFCTVWETFGHNLGLNHNLGMGFRRDFKTDLSRERAQLRDGGVTNCGQFGKISARPLSLFLSWTEFIVSVVLQM